MENENILRQNKAEVNYKRPIIITIICVLGFIQTLITSPAIFIDTSKIYGSGFNFYVLVSIIVGYLCVIGLWQMKKWAAYAYVGLFFLTLILSIAIGSFSIWPFLIHGVVLVIILFHLDKMT
jgi:hypothetical protein